ncbi:AMP-binding protein [Phytohabitans flavus]|uniref:AMP-binding protein n=1 Tax=Phytohabitans flavus TaxID=1076124 RepID=UPI00363705DD
MGRPPGARRTVTWAELTALTGRFGALLREVGTGRGERVALVLPALPETAAAALGALRIGAVIVVMSALWQRDAIAYRLRDCAPTVVFTDRDREPVVRAAVAAAGTGTAVVVLSPTLLDGLTEDAEAVDTGADEPAQISYTSGTTGPAKGIVHAHRRLLGHNEFDVCHDLRPGEVFHGAGDWAWSMMKLLGPWRAGAVQFAYQQGPRFDPVALFAAMADHGVTNLLLNPSVLRRLRQAAPDAGARIPLRPRIACSSSEPLPADLLEWFRDQFGVTLLDYYGCTESYPMVSNRPGQPVKPGSMGTPTPAGRSPCSATTALRCRPAPPARCACGPGPTRSTRWATGGGRRQAPRRSAGSGGTPATWPASTRTATTGTSAAPTTSSSPPATASARTTWRTCLTRTRR